MIEEYLGELSRLLDVAGVRGAAARRLVDETRDHLLQSAARHGEDEAVRVFGPARELAVLVAAELATARTRRAALTTFAALAVAGALYAALFLSLPSAGSPDIFAGSVPGLGALALAGVVFFPQIAFVAGCLAVVRVHRLRARGALPGAELRMQRWRTAVALAAGELTFVSFVAVALDFRRELASWWVLSTVVACAGTTLLLSVAAANAVRAAGPRSFVAGPAEGVVDDLADVLSRVPGLRRVSVPAKPRLLAVVVAAAAAGGVAIAGLAGADPLDGLVRALAEGAAVLACYAALGRPLGLRD